jgi:hypothetical protein
MTRIGRRPYWWSWGLAFGAVAAALEIISRWTPLDGAVRRVVLTLITGLAAGGASYLSLRRSEQVAGAAARWAIVAWALAAATAMAINVYLADTGPRWTYEVGEVRPVEGHPLAVTRQNAGSQSSAFVHLSQTLPWLGAIGGGLWVAILSYPRRSSVGAWLARTALGAVVWALAFVLGGRLAIVAYSYGGHAISDVTESLRLGASLGIVVGRFLGGFLGGCVAGFIGSLAPVGRLRPAPSP